QLNTRSTTSAVTAASPPRTAASSPRRGDHNVPVVDICGRIQAVVESVAGTLPIHRVSDTITCVAPMLRLRANAVGTGSLTPPSIRRQRWFPRSTGIAGNKWGIDALARTASLRLTPCDSSVLKYFG